MITYNQLKTIASEQIFDTFWNILDQPLCKIMVPQDEQKVLDGTPFKATSSHIKKLKTKSTLVEVRCIYDNQDSQVQIKDKFYPTTLLQLYLLKDEIGQELKDHFKIKFQKKTYNIRNIENVANIIYIVTLG